MGEILGLGCTHYPGLLLPDDRLPGRRKSSCYRKPPIAAPGLPRCRPTR